MLVRRLTRFVFAPVLLLTVGALALGGCRGRHCGWHKSPEDRADHVVNRISKELNLTETQRTELNRIKGDVLARQKEFKDLHAGLHAELFAQLRSGTVDKAKLNQDMAAREAKFQDLRAFMIDEFAAFHAMLDSTQREKLAGRLEKMGRRCD